MNGVLIEGKTGNNTILPVTLDGSGKIALTPTLPIDRTHTTISNVYSASLTSHTETLRLTYTVPANRRSLFENAFCSIDPPASGQIAYIKIQVNNNIVLQHIIESGYNAATRFKSYPVHIWLTTGNTIKILTLSTDPASLIFVATIHAGEFDA